MQAFAQVITDVADALHADGEAGGQARGQGQALLDAEEADVQAPVVDVDARRIEAEVIDLRTLRPLDEETFLDSVRRTHRAVVIDEGWRSGSLSAEIAARIQEERFSSQEEADLYRGRFRLNQSIYTRHCEPNTVIMHPLPRRYEIEVEVDKDPRAVYWKQERNGMWMRAALISYLFGVDDEIAAEYR